MAVDESKVLSRTPRLNLPLYKPGATRYDEAINEALQLIDANAVLTPLEADLDMQQNRITNLGDPIDQHDAVPHYLMRLGAAYRRRVTNVPYYRRNEFSLAASVITRGSGVAPQLLAITNDSRVYWSVNGIDWDRIWNVPSNIYIQDAVFVDAIGLILAETKSFYLVKTDSGRLGWIDIVSDPEQINGIGHFGNEVIFTTNQGACYRTADLVNKTACAFSGIPPTAPIIKNNIITSSSGQIGIYETVDGQTFTQTTYDDATLGAPISALRVDGQLFVFTATQLHRFVGGQLQQSLSITNLTDYVYSRFQFPHFLIVADGELRIIDLYGDTMELLPPINTPIENSVIGVYESIYHARVIIWGEDGATTSLLLSDIYHQLGVHYGA